MLAWAVHRIEHHDFQCVREIDGKSLQYLTCICMHKIKLFVHLKSCFSVNIKFVAHFSYLDFLGVFFGLTKLPDTL